MYCTVRNNWVFNIAYEETLKNICAGIIVLISNLYLKKLQNLYKTNNY